MARVEGSERGREGTGPSTRGMARGLGGRGVIGAREIGGREEKGAAGGVCGCDEGRLDGGVNDEGAWKRSDGGLPRRAGITEGGKIKPTGVFTECNGESCALALTRIAPSEGRASLA